MFTSAGSLKKFDLINLQFDSVSLAGVDVLFTDDVTFSPANV